MSCVPCPCDLLGIDSPVECNTISSVFEDPPRLGQLYSGIYTATTYIPELTEGLPSLIQNDFITIVFMLGLGLTLPWLLLILILIIVLAQSGVINPVVTIILFLMTFIIILIAGIFLYTFALYTLPDISTGILSKLSDNWGPK
jgi:hypothetical protein